MLSLEAFPKSIRFADGDLINADCLDALKGIKDNSVTAILIDPPYGAQTQNKKPWDIAWSAMFWKDITTECFRILVKGGHMVVFSGGKTVFDIHKNIEEG